MTAHFIRLSYTIIACGGDIARYLSTLPVDQELAPWTSSSQRKDYMARASVHEAPGAYRK